MSRVVEFRGMDVMTGDWVYGNLVKLGTGSHYIIPQNFIGNNVPQTLVDKETVGQNTDLRDKSGKNIFEGDIIALVNDNTKSPAAVTFEDGAFCIIGYLGDLRTYPIRKYLFSGYELEVIGNMHEHPHLLETEGEQS
ncbi:YopX family protein [Sutcliffiella sp. BMC8]|uniref:YopX family protein n=1 Tax=Sutcliffiella sp. BMC8 TaxID=3073243 RepID=UPI0030D5CBE2